MPSPQVVVLIDGDGAPAVRPPIDDDAIVIAADGGLRLAGTFGLQVSWVIGDLDSVDAEQLDDATASGATIEQHPVDKERTDLELALVRAVALGAGRILVIGGAEGRADHHLGNVAVLAAPELADVEVVAHLGAARLVVVRSSTVLTGQVGSIVSLLAVGAPARDVVTTSLRWPLDREDLEPWSARGLSNELTAPEATIALADGVLLAIQPHHEPIEHTSQGAP